jgi:hypothetical protein
MPGGFFLCPVLYAGSRFPALSLIRTQENTGRLPEDPWVRYLRPPRPPGLRIKTRNDISLALRPDFALLIPKPVLI